MPNAVFLFLLSNSQHKQLMHQSQYLRDAEIKDHRTSHATVLQNKRQTQSNSRYLRS